jgi:serine/threonine-protein kinase
MGTPDYMPPEQALHSRNADIRSDIYSLGCTFYFALTGRPPFPGGDAIEKMLKHQLEQPTPVEELRPGLPGPVRDILARMMAKKKEDRLQTPREIVRTLEIYLEPPARAMPVGPVEPAADWMLDPEETDPAFTPSAAEVETASAPAVEESGIPPLDANPRDRVPSPWADWGLWLLLACAGIGAAIAVFMAARMVVR